MATPPVAPAPAQENFLGWDPKKTVFLYNSVLSPKPGAVTLLYASSVPDATTTPWITGYEFQDTAATPSVPVTVPASMTRSGFLTDPLIKNGALLTAPKAEGSDVTSTSAPTTGTNTAPVSATNPPSPSTGSDTGTSQPTRTSAAGSARSGKCKFAVDSTGFCIPTPSAQAGRFSCVTDDADPSGSLYCLPKADADNKGTIAAAAVLGALLALALALIAWLLMRSRRRHARPAHTPLASPDHSSADGKDIPLTYTGTRSRPLHSQLAAHHATSRAAAPLDDRTVASQMDQLSQDLKDWVLSHAAPGPPSSSLLATLATLVPTHAALLAAPKTRVLVLRAAAAHTLFHTLHDSALERVARDLERSMPDTRFQAWRAETYAHASADTGAADAAAAAVAVLLGARGEAAQAEMRRIAGAAGTLLAALGAQVARFRVVEEGHGAVFRAHMAEDVLQERETTVGADGRARNALEGRRIAACVFPALVKWGDGEGGEWECMTVVARAKVLVAEGGAF
ncbi:hypothetical protein EDC01DRAFT_14807 [Geopyxis carbonaria]|nr:hypothetical protein EDC01DRAFT_14807 [Geopyxis carbonaria]